ncbi:LytR C-terminal domain-containing protein [candidate division KSB1 bacterium]
MVRRKQRHFTEETKTEFNLGEYKRVFIVAVAAVLIVWMLFSILPKLFTGSDPEEVIQPEPPPPPRIEILNGCGADGIARDFAQFLKDNDIDSLNTDNTDHIDKTIIIERDSVGRYGRVISELTGIENITFDDVTQSEYSVTVILGRDYNQFKPFKK